MEAKARAPYLYTPLLRLHIRCRWCSPLHESWRSSHPHHHPWSTSRIIPGLKSHIASFDLESEERTTVIDGSVTKYSSPEEERWYMVLAEFKGYLSVVQTVGPRYHWGDRYTTIWFLVDPEKSIWVKKFTIHMPKSWCYLKALEILGDGRVLMLNSFKKHDDEALFDAQCILQPKNRGSYRHNGEWWGFHRPVDTLYWEPLVSHFLISLHYTVQQ